MDIQALSEPLFRARGWMKFLGVLMIINGVMTALTIIGIIVAWLPIWIGVLLFQSASQAERAYSASDEIAMQASLSKLKTYFTIMGILALIVVVGFVLMMFLGIGSAIFFAGQDFQ